jgi:hypothetical protein
MNLRVISQNAIAFVIMRRTQVRLSENEYMAAKREAERLGVSLAELLRRSLRTVLPVNERKPWMRYAGMIASGNPRASQTIDNVVHGSSRHTLPVNQ